MLEGELLKDELRRKYKSMAAASEVLGLSETTLYKYFAKEKLSADFINDLKEKTGINIRNTSNDIALTDRLEKKIQDLEAKSARLESDLELLKNHLKLLINKK